MESPPVKARSRRPTNVWGYDDIAFGSSGTWRVYLYALPGVPKHLAGEG